MIILLFILSVAFGDAICADGWYSSSSGRGTCSHHGGVATWVVPNAPVYTPPTPKASNESFLSIEGDRKVWRDSNGDPHKLNGPAIERPDSKTYLIHGSLGRLDGGPTFIIDDGNLQFESWLIGDYIPHRTNGPAIKSHIKLYDEALSIYAENGMSHRANGPAIIYYSGPNRHVEIFCKDGRCNYVNVSYETYLVTIDFSSLDDGSIGGSQKVSDLHSRTLEWSRSLLDITERLISIYTSGELISSLPFTEEKSGVTFTLSRKDVSK